MGGLRAALVAVVVVAAGVLHTQAKQELTLEQFWPNNNAAKLNIEDWFRNPAKKAANGLPNMLLEKEEKLDESSLMNIIGVYLPTIDPTVVPNAQCVADVLGILRVLTNPIYMGTLAAELHLWPFTLPDSWGKLPDGILFGNTLPWGMQEECTALNVVEHRNWTPPFDIEFRGHYCLVSLGYTDEPKSKTRGGVRPEARVGAFMTDETVPPVFKYGTCMPSSCTRENLWASIDSIMQKVGKKVISVDCHLGDEVATLNAGDIVFTVILSVIGVILLFAATIDLCINYYDKHKLREGPLKFLLAFSAYSNMQKIFAIKVKEHPDVISCLHGMRVLSMVWVVWGHSYQMLAPVSNNIKIMGMLSDDVFDQIVVNGTFSVDTFLFISGLLVAYSVLREVAENNRVNWIMYYIHRFLRLSPAIMFTAAGMATISRFALAGPYSSEVTRKYIETCRENWWADAFFLGNFVSNCLPQCWYTALDMQLYIVAPIVLLPLISSPKIGKAWLGLVTAVSIATPMIIIAVYNLVPLIFFGSVEEGPKAPVNIYSTPWSRASPYLVGMWAGWLLFSVRGKKIKLNPLVVLVGWLVSAAVALAVLFGMVDYNVYEPDVVHHVSRAVSILYGGLSRVAWGLALLWVVFACHKGHGGIVNSILAHPSWQPLSRLSYCLFLVTIPVQIMYSGAIYIPLYINHLNKVIETCGYLFIGGLIAVPLSLAVEGPIMSLEKILFKRRGRRVTDQKVE